jgi:hypothetical protein
VAKQLSKTLGIELIRFDMSEYMERHSVSRLIGAPPGYVGFDQGGLLTDGIDQHPHCVLLLDEIEKAHQDLYNILLQVMDHGKLTDHNGKTGRFPQRHPHHDDQCGGLRHGQARHRLRQPGPHRRGYRGVKRMFTPEFRNRLDAVIPFAGLTQEIVAQVVEKFVMQLEAQLADRNVTIELSSAAKEWLAERGLRPALRRAPAGPRHPGAHQEAPGRGAAVRQAGQGRRGQGQPRRGRADLRHQGSPARRPAQARRRRRGGEGKRDDALSRVGSLNGRAPWETIGALPTFGAQP